VRDLYVLELLELPESLGPLESLGRLWLVWSSRFSVVIFRRSPSRANATFFVKPK
jgi:hypothetical protein